MPAKSVRLSLAVWITVGVAPRPAQAQSGDVFDQFFRYTETEHKAFTEGMPDETVDPFTGNVHIVHTDVVLPGKAGLDLRVVRSYSSKIWGRTDRADLEPLLAEKERSVLGYGWTFHMGRIKNPYATGGPTSPCSGDYPVLEMPDGSARIFYRVSATNPNVFISRDYWLMEANCVFLTQRGAQGSCVWSTDGVRYEFVKDLNDYNYGTIPVWPASAIVDRFDNAITIEYVGDHTGRMSRITDTYGRGITFGYSTGTDGNRLSTMTVGANIYQFLYTEYLTPDAGPRRFLTEVRPPSGRSFFYSYAITASVAQNRYALASITYPYGGTIQYTYKSQPFYPGVGPSVPFAVVDTRTIGGSAVTGGTWTYAYTAASSGMNTTTIQRPNGRGGTTTDVYTMFGFGVVQPGSYWMVGLTDTIQRAGGAEVERLTWAKSASAVSDSLYSAPGYSVCAGPQPPVDSGVFVPVLQQRELSRDGAKFTTAFPESDAYGQPMRIDEAGSGSRSTTLTYSYQTKDGNGRTLNLVRGRPLTRQVCVSNECFTDSWTYTGYRYSKDSETRAGVTTNFVYHTTASEGPGNLQKVTNARGQTLTLTEYVLGSGTPRKLDFNGAFTVSRATSLEGWILSSETLNRSPTNRTVYTYDGIGRLKTVTPPGQNDATTNNYDIVTLSGVNVTATRGTSYTVTTTYDGFGRAIGTSDTVGVKTTWKHDALGRLWFRSAPFDSVEAGDKMDLDDLGRVTTLTKGCRAASSPSSSCAVTAYVSTVTNVYQPSVKCPGLSAVQTTEERIPDNLTTTRCYSSFGNPDERRLVDVIDAAQQHWSYTYTASGKLLTVAAPSRAGNRTYQYDSRQVQFMSGEKSAERGTIPGDGSVSIRYVPNAIGQVNTRKDARGVTWTYDYTDPLSRLRAIAYGPSSLQNMQQSYQLYSNNVETISTPSSGTLRYSEYDVIDRVRAQTWTYSDGINTPPVFTTRFEYDSKGCLFQINYPTGSVVGQTCDEANRVTSIRLNGATVVSNILYHPSGQPKAMTFANGRPAISIGYDDRSRAQSVSAPGAIGLVFSYDGLDNVTSYDVTQFNGSPLTGARRYTDTSSTKGYDALNRLITVYAPGMWGTAVYDYDELGNREFKSLGTPSGGTSTVSFSYDPDTNRLESASGNVRFTGMTFTWDDAGRLASSSDGATYKYDGLGRRVAKFEPGQTTLYHYDPSGRILAETLGNGAKLRDFVYLGSMLIAVDGCLTGTPPACSPTRQWYHTDALGSVVGRSDATNVQRFDYDPWGERWIAPAVDGDRQYHGKVLDAGTGFYDYGARYYFPGAGRFISPDAKGLSPRHLGNPQKLNQYAYALNNPLSLGDPSGLEEVTIQFRAFVPSATMFIDLGDKRSFSADPDARSRVAVTVRIETDPAKNLGQPILGTPEVSTSPTIDIRTGERRLSTGPMPPRVSAIQEADGGVRLGIQWEMRNPFQSFGSGIRSDVDIVVNQDATRAEIRGAISRSPAFEANFAVDSELRSACFPAINVPLQDASRDFPRFFWNLHRSNQVNKQIDLP